MTALRQTFFQTAFLPALAVISCLTPTNQLSAAPVVFFRGVVNSASAMPPSVPGGAVARGSIFTIFGRDIGPAAPAQVSAFPLGTDFEGVSIEVIQGNATVEAIPIFVSVGQVNAIMPSDAPLGSVTLRVSFGGEQSNPASVTVVANGVGIFTATGTGIGPGIFQNFVAQDNQPLNSTLSTARPGQVVTMWATGLGPIDGDDGELPPVGTLPFAVEIFVGGKAVTNVLYAGRAPCCSGVDQFVFAIPADAPHGCYVPVLVRVNGAAVSNTVTMAIEPNGDRCFEEELPAVTTFIDGGAIGLIDLFTARFELDVGVLAPVSFVADSIAAYFHDETGGQFAFNPVLGMPPHNSCTSYAVAGDILSGVRYPYVNSMGLDAGDITVSGPNGSRSLVSTSKGNETIYEQTNVGGPQGVGPNSDMPLFFIPGEHAAQGPGGQDVGPIDGTTRVDPAVEWNNMEQLDTIRLEEGLTFEWTAAGSPWVALAGVSIDKARNSSGIFICVPFDGASSFTVGPEVLANLPASGPVMGQSTGFVALGVVPPGSPTPFSAAGLDYAAVFSRTIHFKTVVFE